ncbi:hypothetical protein EEE87_04470 [Neisseria gonorrhoeae]
MFHSLSAFTSLNWRTNNGLRYRNLGHGRSRPGSCYCCENLSENPQKITVLKHIFHQAGGTVVPLPKGKVTVSVSLPFI